MALPRGTKRYKHIITGEVRYFRNAPAADKWVKVGTPGSKNWRWIQNGSKEKYVDCVNSIPEGYTLGRLRT